jgi:DNA-binding NtrC family response regulator
VRGGATRIIRGLGGDRLEVRAARVRVVRGPDKGKELVLGKSMDAIIGTDPACELDLTDNSVSRRHAELRAEPDGYVLTDLASTNGIRLGGARVPSAVLDGDGVTFSLGETDLAFKYLDDTVEHALSARTQFGGLLGHAAAMRQLYEVLEQASKSDATVLVEGESGTGKEVVAESLHAASARKEGPFIVVDCSAIPPNLIESELFGHTAGAFTGATAERLGAFEEASGGTLFLDEIGELPLELQPRFLRALEAHEIKRIGETTYRPVDVRVIAASNRDLARRVSEGHFRQDLFFRLAVMRVTVPPLRHRLDDVPVLAREFVRALRPAANPDSLLTPAVLAALASYRWPGNVRELRNSIERLLATGDVGLGQPARTSDPPATQYGRARRDAIDRFEREYCRALLAQSGGVVSRAAEQAGLSRQMLHRLLKKHDVASDE